MGRSRGLDRSSESDWISIADLMTGLMMIFLFIAIHFMNHLQVRDRQIQEIVVTYQALQEDLYEDLRAEFEDDLPGWGAELDRATLSVRFLEPKVLFRQGSSLVSPRFEAILGDFFPRYIALLRTDRYRNTIEELRIEGHTSSEWSRAVDSETAYFRNLELSQDRTRAVLERCLSLVHGAEDRHWTRRFATANGLASSRLVRDPSGVENPARSRRVEFRTKTAAERKVVEVLTALENPS